MSYKGYDPKYYLAHKETILQQNRKSYLRHRGKRREHHIEYNRKVRLGALVHYSGSSVPVCACCGEKHLEFLGIDHVEGGGTQHRKRGTGVQIAFWLRRQGYPNGYQVLCHNCNMALGFYGYCPHKRLN